VNDIDWNGKGFIDLLQVLNVQKISNKEFSIQTTQRDYLLFVIDTGTLKEISTPDYWVEGITQWLRYYDVTKQRFKEAPSPYRPDAVEIERHSRINTV